MVKNTSPDARTRASAALAQVALEYATPDDLAPLARAGDGWQSEAIAMLAEAVAARHTLAVRWAAECSSRSGAGTRNKCLPR